MSAASAALRPIVAPSGLEVPSLESSLSGGDRRTEPRFTPTELRNRLVVRYRYGEPVTLVDLSVGGMQFETPQVVRPDVDVALEIINSRTREASQVVTRILRANVSALAGGIKYRAACAFRRPLSNPTLLVPVEATTDRSSVPEHLKLELALKTILERYFSGPRGVEAGYRRDPSRLLDALVHLRSAAERRPDPVDRRLGVLLAAMIPALQRRETPDAVLRRLHDQLAEQLPLLAIRTADPRHALAQDCESITLNVSVNTNPTPMAITADFPAGFSLDASQFRMLKLGAYLVGLIESWSTQVSTAAPTASTPSELEPMTRVAEATDERSDSLPHGWHRVVLRCMDGQLLHGFSNDFYPDRSCFQVSPCIGGSSAERKLVPVAHLKAVFFVKDLQGDPDRVDVQTFDHKPRGRKVRVTFRDGEVMTGSTLSYKPTGQGFFLTPADSGSNNVRAFIVTAAIRHICYV